MAYDLKATVAKHLAYCEANHWSGVEPYDALNSRIVAALPFLNARLPRLALTQLLKRSPVNIRPLLLIGSTQNPKAITLFLSAFLKLSQAGVEPANNYVHLMIERLIMLRSKGVPYWCWGYSFAWQTRTVLVPKFFPNLVCTCFAANALLDAYASGHDQKCLEMAHSAAEYLLNELYWQNGSRDFGFSYPLTGLQGQVHNANFLAAALLCRIYKHSGEKKFLEPALDIARYSLGKQNADGSWYYGEDSRQRWIDNFHTGYNLTALRAIDAALGTSEFESSVRRGFEFYRAHFFRADGAVGYYHNQTYPIDTHCIAQGILTLLEFKDLYPAAIELANRVFEWAMDHMWDDRGGFFYYRILRACTIRTSYMRWTQAWMFLAMAALLVNSTPLKDARQRPTNLAELSVC